MLPFDRLSELLLHIILSPALWLSLALALGYSISFAAWHRSGWRQFWRYLLAGLMGFGGGHLAGVLLGSRWLQVGQVQILWGTLGAFIALSLGRLIWRAEAG